MPRNDDDDDDDLTADEIAEFEAALEDPAKGKTLKRFLKWQSGLETPGASLADRKSTPARGRPSPKLSDNLEGLTLAQAKALLEDDTTASILEHLLQGKKARALAKSTPLPKSEPSTGLATIRKIF